MLDWVAHLCRLLCAVSLLSVLCAAPASGENTSAAAAAWLSGLREAGDALAANNAVRLAQLGVTQRQGLASLMALVTVREEPADGFQVAVRIPEGWEISRFLGKTEEIVRQAEVIAAMEYILSETTGTRQTDAVRAYGLYLQALQDFSGVWNKPDAALALLEAALRLAPDEYPLLLAQGEILLALNRPQAAWQVLSNLRIQAAIPMRARTMRLRALASVHAGRPALAEKDLEDALHLAPEQAELWLARGASRQMQQNFEAMCNDYYRACVLGSCEELAAAREHGLCPAQNGSQRAE